MKQRKLLVVLLALILVLSVFAVVACETEKVTATAVTLDASKIDALKAGDQLDINKLKITVKFSDNTQKDLAAADVTITIDGKAYTSEALTEGEHTVKVSYVEGNGAALTAEAKITVSHAHSFGEMVAEVAATCTTTGTKAHKDCSLCSKHFDSEGKEIADLTIAALGHDMDDGVVTTAATCIATGIKTLSCKRTGCDHKTTEVVAIDANAHSFGEMVAEVAATCTTAGTKAHKDCSLCNKHFDSEGKEIADLTIVALGHKYGEWAVTTAATCEAAGEETRTCTNSGCTEKETRTIVALGHDMDDGVVTTPATCSATGIKTFSCKRTGCDHKTTEVIAIDANAHSFGEMVAEVAATCTTAGTKAHKDCSLCSKHFDSEGKEIDDLTMVALGHDMDDGVVTTAATCIATGIKTFSCKRTGCDHKTTEVIAIDANAHSFGEMVAEVAATCTTAGTKAHKDCSLCSKHFDSEGKEIDDLTIVALNHDFENGTEVDGSRTAATCSATGKYTVKCSRCDETKEITLEIDANAHNYEGQPYKAGENGHYQECKYNAEHHSATVAHEGGTATCKELATCSKCNTKYGSLADHDYNELVSAKAATIDAPGNVEYKQCKVCNKYFDKDGKELETIVIPQLESVTISFSGIERDSIRIEKGTKTTIAEPTLADNVFVNWTDAEGKVVDVTAAFSTDVTLTANFKEGYNFKKNHEGAAITTSTESANQGIIAQSDNLDTGITYKMTSQNAVYNITLPCVNYSKFAVVAFKWKASDWLQIGTNNDRNHGQVEIEGMFEVIKEGETYKTVFFDSLGNYYTGAVSDADIINGTKGLNVINAVSVAPGTRWFGIEVFGVSHVYDDGIMQRVLVREDNSNFIHDSNYYDLSATAGNYTLAVQAIDYTKYSKVTFNWKSSVTEWMAIGLSSGSKFSKVSEGTIVVAKNDDGKYIATLTVTATGETKTKELSEEEINGKKGLLIYYYGAAYYKLTVDKLPTYEK